MKANQALFALVIAAVAPLAAQAETPDVIKFQDAPSILSVAQVRADYLSSDRSGQRFGEAYPVAIAKVDSVKTRQEVRSEFLASNRTGQRFGEAYPASATTTTTDNIGDVHAEVR